MTNDEARQLVRSVLRQVAPEADIDEVGTGETLQEETGFEIPERDYPQLSTVEGCTAYLTSIDFRP